MCLLELQALKYGFLQFDAFNVDEYEHYEVIALVCVWILNLYCFIYGYMDTRKYGYCLFIVTASGEW